MAKYFSKFPFTYYSLNNSLDIITNITSRFILAKSIKDNAFVYDNYIIKEGETPEIIAAKLYNSPERHWMVLLANDIVDIESQWPLSEYTLSRYIDKKYKTESINGIQYAMSNVHSYYKVETIKLYSDLTLKSVNRFEIDKDTYDNLIESFGDVIDVSNTLVVRDIERSYTTYFDFEIEENEKKRSIKLFRTEFVDILEQEFKRIFNDKGI